MLPEFLVFMRRIHDLILAYHNRVSTPLVYDCLSNLEGCCRGMFIFCTKGLYSGNAVRNVASLAVARGFEFRGNLEIIMPGTDGLILYARKASLTERFLKAIVSRRISEKVERFISLLETGVHGKIPSEKWYTLLDDSIVRPLEIRFNNRYRNWIGQFHSMADRCTRCLECVRGCPRENIRLTEQGVIFGLFCLVNIQLSKVSRSLIHMQAQLNSIRRSRSQ